MDILWFTDSVSLNNLDKYSGKLHLALISLDSEFGLKAGKELYCQNPDCRICYYRTNPCKLEPLLSSRPICFYLWEQGEKAFKIKFEQIIDEISSAKDIFHYETKGDLYLIPFRNILYLQSDLKYVNIYTINHNDGRFFSKLSQIEEKLSSSFVRIHKSYIVNEMYVECVDKKTHTVQLSNGENMPISNAQYEQVINRFRKSGIIDFKE